MRIKCLENKKKLQEKRLRDIKPFDRVVCLFHFICTQKIKMLYRFISVVILCVCNCILNLCIVLSNRLLLARWCTWWLSREENCMFSPAQQDSFLSSFCVVILALSCFWFSFLFRLNESLDLHSVFFFFFYFMHLRTVLFYPLADDSLLEAINNSTEYFRFWFFLFSFLGEWNNQRDLYRFREKKATEVKRKTFLFGFFTCIFNSIA